jgi:hypothetical protein
MAKDAGEKRIVERLMKMTVSQRYRLYLWSHVIWLQSNDQKRLTWCKRIASLLAGGRKGNP